MWNFPYESPSFENEMEEVWNQISPLYEQMHAYVRRKLRDLYGPDRISKQAPLPSHILGNLLDNIMFNFICVNICLEKNLCIVLF